MGLFRRIFGKVGDEGDTPEASTTSTKDTEAKNEEESQEETSVSEQISEDVKNEDFIATVEVAVTGEDALEEHFDSATKPIATAPLPQRSIIDGATRPLAPDQMYPMQEDIAGIDVLTYGVSSDVGRVRSNNQDAAQAFFVTGISADDHPDFGMFIVADGMGGHHDGEKASAITVRTVTAQIMKSIYLPMFGGDEKTERVPITEALIAAIQSANKEVMTNVPDGGTTATVVSIIGDLAHFAHVGDSRAYLISREGIDQVTRDHSLVQRLIELGQLTQEEAEEHPQKNVLYRALGQNETLEVDAMTRRLPANSRLLLCSDGLWGLIPERDIYETVMNTSDPQQACEKLVAQANAKGGLDNITAVLIKVSK
ncbi:MAG: protein phosphatase 2C domain-containing protein [Aggregatilineales bacterium]